MSVLSWGKCSLTTTTSTDGAPAAEAVWTAIDTPKEDTTKITPTAGTEKTATEEGGDLVDSRFGKNSFQFEFDLFVKKNVARPFEDNDGIIAGEHAFRIAPEDTTCEGAQIDRCVVRVEESYSTADGKLLHYVAKCLKPKTGKIVKPYTVGA
jgi:hypothetical protein